MNSVSAALIEREGTWDPQVFAGPMVPLLQLPDSRTACASDAVILEGWRASRGTDAVGPVYRASNVGEFELRLEPDHCSTPVRADERCVRPGDIVVTKGTPIRAALTPVNVFRHPVDANCYLVRGLELAEGLWFAMCVNQPMFADYLVRKSGAGIVSRVRSDVLATSRFPRRPLEIDWLSERVMGCLEQRVDSDIELIRFQAKVREVVASRVPASDATDEPLRSGSTAWCQFFSPAAIEDSLVPEHVAISGHQQQLRHDAGWSPIRHLLSSRRSGGERLGESVDRIRTLRLSDVGDDLMVRRGEVRGWGTSSRRVFAEPVQENEVLLSALVSRPRIAFLGNRPEEPIYPTDHWHRLRFRETPGAWALVLSTDAVHHQLERLAIGTVQQFAPPRAIGRLVLPDIPLGVRIKWDSAIRRWQRRRRELDDEWGDVMSECYRMLRETHHTCGPWTQPPSVIRDSGEWK